LTDLSEKLNLTIERIYENARPAGPLGAIYGHPVLLSSSATDHVSWGEQVGTGLTDSLEMEHGWGLGDDRPRSGDDGVTSAAVKVGPPGN
jgi:hypothetical protein